MQALQLTAVHQLVVTEVPDPVPGPGEALVALRAAALNHRDVWIKSGQYAGLKFPCIPGSDGAGVVEAVGAEVDANWVGREVILNPALDWGTDEAKQAGTFSILGMPRNGTMAEKIAIPADQLAPKPAHLSWEEAAALPLTGLTAFRALFTRARLRPADRVLLTGIGGGVASIAFRFCLATAAECWVTSGSADRITHAIELGARGGFLYHQPGWAEEARHGAGGFDLILDSAGGEGFDALIDVVAPGGRIVFIGATRGNPPGLALRKIFWRQISLLGSTMGSPADWEAMLAFVSAHRIIPQVGTAYPLSEAAASFAVLESGKQLGKLVLRIR